MVVITVEAYENAKVYTITMKNKQLFWVKMMDVPKGLSSKNIHDLARKEVCGIFETKNFAEEQNKKYIRTEREISKILTDDIRFKYTRSDLIEKITKNGRGLKKSNDGINRMEKEEQRDSFRTLLGFNENDIMNREEYTLASQIEQVFANEKIKQQHFVLNKYYINYYFREHKLAVEIDEKAYLDRNEGKDKKREKEIKAELDCAFIRINPSKVCFNINIELSKIHNHIIEST